MHICQLTLRNFRGIRDGIIHFPEHCVIIGRNNSGKSTIADALALLLGRERVARGITDFDFTGGQPSANTRFTIVGTITGFVSDDSNDYPDWFNTDRGGTACWWMAATKELRFGEQPEGGKLAVQIAFCGRFDEELCEFEPIRYFYDGEGDPFVGEYVSVPLARLREIGTFYLPSERNSERVLTFGSSTFLKVMKENEAIPSDEINELKAELRDPSVKVETSERFSQIVERAKAELAGFVSGIEEAELVYRVSNLDTESVMKSLLPHIRNGDLVIPLNRQGSGVISLQLLLLLLEFARFRKETGKNFLLIAEEPELHLYPGAQRRMVQRIRNGCVQSILTTHSATVASHYLPQEILFIRNEGGNLVAEPLLRHSLNLTTPNAFQKLFVARRTELCNALMSKYVLLPEGQGDAEWINLMLRIYEAQTLLNPQDILPSVSGIGIIPTQDANVVQTYNEISRVRPDIVPLLDGDAAGQGFVDQLLQCAHPPMKSIRLANGLTRENMICWLVEPMLEDALEPLRQIFGNNQIADKDTLLAAISLAKSNSVLLENLAWEIQKHAASLTRCKRILEDIGRILKDAPNALDGWTIQQPVAGQNVVFVVDILV